MDYRIKIDHTSGQQKYFEIHHPHMLSKSIPTHEIIREYGCPLLFPDDYQNMTQMKKTKVAGRKKKINSDEICRRNALLFTSAAFYDIFFVKIFDI